MHCSDFLYLNSDGQGKYIGKDGREWRGWNEKELDMEQVAASGMHYLQGWFRS